MKNITQIELLNGESVDIQLGYNPLKCMKIARDFSKVNEVFSLAMTGEGNTQSFEFDKLASAVYIAYRQANMKNYMTFEEFFDEENGYEFDMAEAIEIYTAMLDRKQADAYLEKMSKLASKGKKAKKA